MQSANYTTIERLPLKTSDFIQYVDFPEIIWVKALKKQSQLYIKGKPEVITSTFSFGDLEDMLPSTFFFKCHRSTIINLSHLQRFYKGKRLLLLSDNQCVVIAEGRIGEFEHRIHSIK